MIYNYILTDDNQNVIEVGSVNADGIISATNNTIKLVFDKNEAYIENVSQYYNEDYSFIAFRRSNDRLFAIVTKKR